MRNEQFESLPFVGARLVRLRFCGNGKDSEVTLEAAGSRKAIIPLSDARVDLSLSGPISITTRGWGDTETVWEIVPTPEQFVRIEEAAIGFQGIENEWAEALHSYKQTGTLNWAVTLRLKLVATE